MACFPAIVKNDVFVAKICKYALYERSEGFCCGTRNPANPCHPAPGCFKNDFSKIRPAEPTMHQPWGWFKRIPKYFWFQLSLGVPLVKPFWPFWHCRFSLSLLMARLREGGVKINNVKIVNTELDPFKLTLRLMRGGFRRFYFGKSHFLKHLITHIPRDVIILTWQCHPRHVPSFPRLPGQPILAWVQVVSKQLDLVSDFQCFHVWTFTQPCCVLFRFCCVECSYCSGPHRKAPGHSTLVSILCQNSPPPPPPFADTTKLQTGTHSRA